MFSLEVRLIAAIGLALSLWAGFEWKLHEAKQEGVAECQQAHAAQAATEERRRVQALAEVANEAQRQSNRARADADAARPAHDRLLDRANAIAVGGASASAGGASATGPGLVLAGVLGRADGVAGELAEALDQARTAGLACERAYDSLTLKGKP